MTVEPAGVETEVTMDEWVPVGVFAPSEQGADLGGTLYRLIHGIRSDEQTVTEIGTRGKR